MRSGGTNIDPTDVFANNLGHWVRRVYHEITLRTNEVLRPYGLARSQWEVLYRIVSTDGVTQKDSQTAMDVESGTLTGIVDSLVKKGWLVRDLRLSRLGEYDARRSTRPRRTNCARQRAGHRVYS
ncbi:MAG: MarR family winged helix-turn-helix transcriptional regulator [Bacilli bacterium]